MNLNVLLFAGMLLAVPSAVNAFTVQCEGLLETTCTVKSDNSIKSVRVEIYPGGNNSSISPVNRDFRDCPKEVSVNLDYVPSGTRFFVETCDGSNAIETIR